MILPPRGRRPLTLGLLVFALVALVMYQGRHRSYMPMSFTSFRPHKPASRPSYSQRTPSAELVQFWSEVLEALMQAKPKMDAIKTMEMPPDKFLAPDSIKKGDPPKERYDKLELSSEELDALRQSHAQAVRSAKQLTPRMPLTKHSRGIVMTAGGKYVGNAVLSLLMLRRTGSTLPVQLFLDSPDAFASELCDTTMVELNVECHTMNAVFKMTPHMPELKKFQYKVFALLFSSFEDVLFLDADAFPIHSPDHFFDVEPYKSHGLVTWPDYWLSTASKHFYDIAGIPVPPVEAHRTSETGIIMFKRSTQADTLLLSAYYNFYGPDYYYTLLSQGAHGEGDKETFLAAASALGNPVYHVRTTNAFPGRWINDTYDSAGMLQADPMEDFRLNGQRTKLVAGSRFEGEIRARYFFMHHNAVKIDISRLGESMKTAFRKNKQGKLDRLWGDQSSLTKTAGYDVERAMWDEIIRVNCRQSFLQECNDLRAYYSAVFLEEDNEEEKKEADKKEAKEESKDKRRRRARR